MSKFINKVEAKRLIKKLEMKYGAELQLINEQLKDDIQTFGSVQFETEARREFLLEQIKAEEKNYK